MNEMIYDEVAVVGGGKGSCRCYDEKGSNIISTALSYGNSCYDFCCIQHSGFRWELSGSHESNMGGECKYGKPGNKNHDSKVMKDIGKKVLDKLF